MIPANSLTYFYLHFLKSFVYLKQKGAGCKFQSFKVKFITRMDRVLSKLKYFRLPSLGKGSPPVTAAAPVLTVLCGPHFYLGLLPFPPSFINQAAHQALNTHKQGKSCPGEQTKGQKGELTLWRKHSHLDLGQEPSSHISNLSVGSRRVPSLHSVPGVWGSISMVALPSH